MKCITLRRSGGMPKSLNPNAPGKSHFFTKYESGSGQPPEPLRSIHVPLNRWQPLLRLRGSTMEKLVPHRLRIQTPCWRPPRSTEAEASSMKTPHPADSTRTANLRAETHQLAFFHLDLRRVHLGTRLRCGAARQPLVASALQRDDSTELLLTSSGRTSAASRTRPPLVEENRNCADRIQPATRP